MAGRVLFYVPQNAIATSIIIFFIFGFVQADNRSYPTCQENRKFCYNDTSCLLCKNGYTGKTCEEVCLNCLPGTACDSVTGYCLEHCSYGLSGDYCNISCASKCMSCNRRFPDYCISCAHNRYGKSCKDKCSVSCINSTCDEHNGACTLGCSDGFWGHRCDQRCSTHCRDKLCDNTTGDCLIGCSDGYSGINCSIFTGPGGQCGDIGGNTAAEELWIKLFVGLAFIFILVIFIYGIRKFNRKRRKQQRHNTSKSDYRACMINSRPDETYKNMMEAETSSAASEPLTLHPLIIPTKSHTLQKDLHDPHHDSLQTSHSRNSPRAQQLENSCQAVHYEEIDREETRATEFSADQENENIHDAVVHSPTTYTQLSQRQQDNNQYEACCDDNDAYITPQ